MWEERLGTQAGVHLIEGVRLIRGPLNTGFTVLCFPSSSANLDSGAIRSKLFIPSFYHRRVYVSEMKNYLRNVHV